MMLGQGCQKVDHTPCELHVAPGACDALPPGVPFPSTPTSPERIRGWSRSGGVEVQHQAPTNCWPRRSQGWECTAKEAWRWTMSLNTGVREETTTGRKREMKKRQNCNV